jgi:hypothetical protein
MSVSPFVPLLDWSVLLDPTVFPDEMWCEENKQKPLLIDYENSDVDLYVETCNALGPAVRYLRRLAYELKDHIRDVYFFRDWGLEEESVIFGRIKSGEFFVLKARGYCTGYPMASVTITFSADPEWLYNFVLDDEDREQFKLI